MGLIAEPVQPQVALLSDVARDEVRSHPVTGAFVSRSYAEPFAAVAWFSDRVGVDIEQIGPLTPEFGASICTPEELQLAGARLEDPVFVTSLWSSKEALSKALGDALEYDPRRLAAPLFWSHGAAGRWRARRLDFPRVTSAGSAGLCN